VLIVIRPIPLRRRYDGDAAPAVGDAVLGLRRAGRSYSAAIRLITLPVAATVAVAAPADAAMRLAATAAWTVVALWSVVYVRQMLRTRARWITLVDCGVLSCLALATPLIVPLSWLSTGKSWLVPFCTFACVAYQYYERWALGGTAALGVVASMITGTALGRPDGSAVDGLITACWSLVVTLLARLLWTLVHRGGAQADAAVAAAAKAGRTRKIAARVRADGLFTNRKLHDTSAATLLMVGTGQAQHAGAKLSAQAERDLAFLRALRDNAFPAQSDLVDLLCAELAVMPVNVVWTTAERVTLPPMITHALADAATEALRNAARHSGADSATVSVSGGPHGIRVEISDQGRGFDLHSVPATRRGVRDSIVGRMADIGGRAYIDSAVGAGTTVRLEWRDG
jgi:hypothetical protein